MVIALLAVLGVDLIVIVFFLGILLSRRRWVSRQPGAFKGAIRVVHGDVPGLKPKWMRGYGRWVGEVLVWTRAPLLFRNEFVVAESLAGPVRPAKPGEIKRLGENVAFVRVAIDHDAQLEVAVAQSHRDLACGPFAAASAAGPERIPS